MSSQAGWLFRLNVVFRSRTRLPLVIAVVTIYTHHHKIQSRQTFRISSAANSILANISVTSFLDYTFNRSPASQ